MSLPLPIVQSHIVNGRIGVDWSIGRYHIKMRSAEIATDTIPTKISAPTRFATMSVDLSKTHDALHGGQPLALFKKLQGQMASHAAQNIKSVIGKWNKIGNIADGDNPIPELAKQASLKGGPDLQVFGPATPNNIDISFDIPRAQADIRVGRRDIQFTLHKPEISYSPGVIDVYLKQRPNLQFKVQHLDIRA